MNLLVYRVAMGSISVLQLDRDFVRWCLKFTLAAYPIIIRRIRLSHVEAGRTTTLTVTN